MTDTKDVPKGCPMPNCPGPVQRYNSFYKCEHCGLTAPDSTWIDIPRPSDTIIAVAADLREWLQCVAERHPGAKSAPMMINRAKRMLGDLEFAAEVHSNAPKSPPTTYFNMADDLLAMLRKYGYGFDTGQCREVETVEKHKWKCSGCGYVCMTGNTLLKLACSECVLHPLMNFEVVNVPVATPKEPVLLRRTPMERIKSTFKHGGPHLGAVRRWMQWTFRNGSSVTWGSDDQLAGTGMSVRQFEELAEQIKDAIIGEVESIIGDSTVIQKTSEKVWVHIAKTSDQQYLRVQLKGPTAKQAQHAKREICTWVHLPVHGVPQCTCDDIGEGECPIHRRENSLQDRALKAEEEIGLLRLILDQKKALIVSVETALTESHTRVEVAEKELQGYRSDSVEYLRQINELKAFLSDECDSNDRLRARLSFAVITEDALRRELHVWAKKSGRYLRACKRIFREWKRRYKTLKETRYQGHKYRVKITEMGAREHHLNQKLSRVNVECESADDLLTQLGLTEGTVPRRIVLLTDRLGESADTSPDPDHDNVPATTPKAQGEVWVLHIGAKPTEYFASEASMATRAKWWNKKGHATHLFGPEIIHGAPPPRDTDDDVPLNKICVDCYLWVRRGFRDSGRGACFEEGHCPKQSKLPIPDSKELPRCPKCKCRPHIGWSTVFCSCHRALGAAEWICYVAENTLCKKCGEEAGKEADQLYCSCGSCTPPEWIAKNEVKKDDDGSRGGLRDRDNVGSSDVVANPLEGSPVQVEPTALERARAAYRGASVRHDNNDSDGSQRSIIVCLSWLSEHLTETQRDIKDIDWAASDNHHRICALEKKLEGKE